MRPQAHVAPNSRGLLDVEGGARDGRRHPGEHFDPNAKICTMEGGPAAWAHIERGRAASAEAPQAGLSPRGRAYGRDLLPVLPRYGDGGGAGRQRTTLNGWRWPGPMGSLADAAVTATDHARSVPKHRGSVGTGRTASEAAPTTSTWAPARRSRRGGENQPVRELELSTLRTLLLRWGSRRWGITGPLESTTSERYL